MGFMRRSGGAVGTSKRTSGRERLRVGGGSREGEGEGTKCLLVARFKIVKDPVTGEETMVPLPPICFDEE